MLPEHQKQKAAGRFALIKSNSKYKDKYKSRKKGKKGFLSRKINLEILHSISYCLSLESLNNVPRQQDFPGHYAAS